MNDVNKYISPIEDVCDILRTAGFSGNRCNQDDTPDRDSYVIEIIELCRNNSVVIFNGRMNEDRGIGKFTAT